MSRNWTADQQKAIASRGQTLVAAAAGSGKTSVLSELISTMLINGEISPSQLCAVTFTNKASQEMKGRIASRLSAVGELDLVAQLDLAAMGTIHSLCNVIVRSYGVSLGVDPNMVALEPSQNAWILDQAVNETLREVDDDEQFTRLRYSLRDEQLQAHVSQLASIYAAHDTLPSVVSAEEIVIPVVSKKGSNQGELIGSPSEIRASHTQLLELAQRVFAKYSNRKQELGGITYDDLERYALRAVRDPEILHQMRERWGIVLVDEFQDTNETQFEILSKIADTRMFMVGDEWQSIYRFRGADVSVFRARRQAAKNLIPMRENFRTDAAILSVVNQVFSAENVFGDRYEPVVPGTDQQRNATDIAVELLLIDSDPKTNDSYDLELVGKSREREARRVAEYVAEIIESERFKPSEIAILYQKNNGIHLYENALRRWGIPVIRTASSGYFERQEVQDVICVLNAIRNHKDTHAHSAVLRGPLGRVSVDALANFLLDAKTKKQSIRKSMQESADPSINRVSVQLDALEQILRNGTIVDLVMEIISSDAFTVGSALRGEGKRVTANLKKVVDLARSANAIALSDISSFVDFLHAQERQGDVSEAAIADQSSGAVSMMTIHQSKGLEFPCVVIVEAGAPKPRDKAFVSAKFDSNSVLHTAIHNPSEHKLVRSGQLEEIKETEAQLEHEESLRLWYVAMTRAKHQLVISGLASIAKINEERYSGVYTWLLPALQETPIQLAVNQITTDNNIGVSLNTFLPRRTPTSIWNQEAQNFEVPSVLVTPKIQSEEETSERNEAEEFSLANLLREQIEASSNEFVLQQGERLHSLVERSLRDGIESLTTKESDRIRPLRETSLFQELLAHEVRTEVSYILGPDSSISSHAAPGVRIVDEEDSVDVGRIDALVVKDNQWWIIDWKTTLPMSEEEALQAHSEQLKRYVTVAKRGGAERVRISLVSLNNPEIIYEWNEAQLLAPTP